MSIEYMIKLLEQMKSELFFIDERRQGCIKYRDLREMQRIIAIQSVKKTINSGLNDLKREIKHEIR